MLLFSYKLIVDCVKEHWVYETQIKNRVTQVNTDCVNLFKQQKFEQAETKLHELISLLNSIYDNQKELATAKYNLGSVLFSQQKWPLASQELEQAIKLYQQTSNPTSAKKAQEKLAECKKYIAPLKYIRIKTHGVMRINLKNPPQQLTGLCTLPTPTESIWLNAKSQTELLSICTMLITDTDLIAQQLAWLKDEYTLYYMVDKKYATQDKDIKFLTRFFERLNASLAQLKIRSWVSHYHYFFESLISGFDFAGNFLSIKSKETVEEIPFADVRRSISHINFIAKDQSKSDSQYQLDLQFDSNEFTPLPKFSDQGLFLYKILRNDNYQMMLFSNPTVSEEIRDLFCNPSNSMKDVRNRWVSDYEEYFKKTNKLAEQFLNHCQNALEKLDLEKALSCAERALAILKQFNEELVEALLMQAYYQLGTLFFRQNIYQKATSKLEKAKKLSHQFGRLDILQKINAMLTEAQQKCPKHSIPTLLSLPSELILRIASYLNTANTGRLAQVSSYTNKIANNDYLWKDKVELDFTKSLLPQEERSYRKQYADYYLKIKQLYNAHTKQHTNHDDDYDSNDNEPITSGLTIPKPITVLKLAFEMGAEIQVEKLLSEDAVFSYELDLVEALLTSRNKNLLPYMLNKSLNVNQTISCDYQTSISIFHLAIFLTPDSIPQLLATQPDITILPPLHVAVLKNEITKIKSLLADIENVDEKDLSNCTPLWWALMLNNFTATHLLLARGANINIAIRFVPYQLEWSPHRSLYKQLLPYVIFHNHNQCLELLLKTGYAANSMVTHHYELTTLLTLAMGYGKTNIVKLLISYGAKINLDLDDEQIISLTQPPYCETTNFSTLAAACSNNQVACLKLLVDLGADPNALEVNAYNCDGKDAYIDRQPPLFAAIASLHIEAVRYLLSKSDSPNPIGMHFSYDFYKKEKRWDKFSEYSINTLDKLLSAVEYKLTDELNNPNYNPENPHFKLTNNWLVILELLLKHGVDINANLQTSTHHSSYSNKSAFCIEFIKCRTMRTNDSNETVIKNNQQKLILLVLRKLVAHNINIDLQDNDGQTAMHYAVTQGYEDIVIYLVKELKAKIDIKDKNGETPIFIAARQTNQKLFKFLVNSGSKLDEKNTKNETPMEVITTQFTRQLSM